jgi:rubredoxin-NAD+ reductase
MITTEHPIVIIGTGLAGISLAKEVRKLNPDQLLVLITQDDGHFYSKPMLSTALHQAKTPQSLVVTNVETLQTQLNATIYTFSSVLALNPHKGKK